jgi:phage tail sheath protein FI
VWFTADPPTEVPIDDVDTFTRLPEADAVPGTPVDETHFPGDMNPIVASANPKVSQMYGRGRGLAAVAAIDEVSLLLAPDEVRFDPDSLTTDIINQCEQLKDRFAIVSAPQGQNDTGPVRPPFDTSYAAYYYPWIEVYDPVTRSQIRIPPTGHVAGIVARTDIERGVHKAPANEVVRGAADLEFAVTKGMQDILNPRGVNCVRDFRADGRGIRLWGARTMSSDPQWKYVNVRRLFLFVEESIDEGTQWVVFEPNDEPLWAQVRRSITNFLIRVWRSGALMGLTQEEAFFVKCDRTTMTQDDIDNGRLVCYIGIAPVKPAEFVIFRISQKTLEATA